MRVRTLRTQQRVICQCQLINNPELGATRLALCETEPDSFGRNIEHQLNFCQFQTHSFMESLILAQDERWRRA